MEILKPAECPKLKLADWRRREGLTQQQLADALGCVIASVARYEAGLRVPEGDTMVAIYVRSYGEVQPNDFYELPKLPARAAERAVARDDAREAA